ncbi:class I SAM-dependent methyltransferase [Limnovirga soli]|uniref:Methyltransferase domain-containing protein n=1 Tax=Limnovirga soli TaxID=2656915 RepID=A0A8J8JPP9_9BACT|nr:class I SAM-dependent methyltransferase [Limnovirga soli]NNV53837.1 methyltransferase domain-containing protein [Limnovirga soli]
MSNLITYRQCPICSSTQITAVLDAKDYTVSKNNFSIWHCQQCNGRFTQHVPDAASIGAYYQSADYISHSDTKKGLVNRLYHFVRSYTLQSKKNLVKEVSRRQNGVLLDVGAGTGAFAATMQQANWQVTGLEPDAIARENAMRNHGLPLESLSQLFSFPAQSFDVITMWHVLEHVHDLHPYIKTFQKILKQQGVLIIAVPNYTSYDATLYNRYWAAYDVPRHLYHFSPQSMQQLMAQHGFIVDAYRPMWFDSFYVAMLSEQYKNGHNNFLNAIWNGFISNLKTLANTERCSSVIYIIRKK